jgi:hypothetical protein
MDRAQTDDGAVRRAALAAGCVTDQATLRRVADALLVQLGGTVSVPPEYLAPCPPAGILDRRTVTRLPHVSGARP